MALFCAQNSPSCVTRWIHDYVGHRADRGYVFRVTRSSWAGVSRRCWELTAPSVAEVVAVRCCCCCCWGVSKMMTLGRMVMATVARARRDYRPTGTVARCDADDDAGRAQPAAAALPEDAERPARPAASAVINIIPPRARATGRPRAFLGFRAKICASERVRERWCDWIDRLGHWSLVVGPSR